MIFEKIDISQLSSLVSQLSIFLFIIAGNYAGDLYSCGLRHLFNEYMILKHIIGFFIMLFFVGLLQKQVTLFIKVVQSIILYFWYILIMRAPTIITLIAIILICIIFLINIYIEDIKNKNSKNTENSENSIKKEENNKEISNKINYYQKISNILFIISFTISLMGTTIFIILLKNKLGNNFNIYKFILGSRDQECFTEEIYNIFKTNPLFFEWNRITKTKNKNKNKNFIPKKVERRLIK
tara:strand:+ start:129 stop:845 length:717 start_codon:yes stop_codon:yes gene_type:complete